MPSSPGRVRSGGGRPYRVFTAFRRGWSAAGWPRALGAADRGALAAGAGSTATPAEIGSVPDSPHLPDPAGEAAAESALEAFLDGPVGRYADDRDRPDRDGTSRLSPYLRFGTLHPRQILARLPPGPGAESYRSELAWREFYADVLWHHPGSAWEPLQPSGARCGGTPAPGPTSGSRPGPPVRPGSRWSTRACASCGPRGGCTTGSGW